VIRSISLAALGVASTFFHAHLTSSFPKANDVVRAAPAQIRLAFSERPTVKLTSIKLLRADSSAVDIAKPVGDRDTLAVTAKLPTALPTGTYAVVWKTASRDGHVIRGRYVFTYSATAQAPVPVTSAAAPAAPAHSHP
jgi:methionine-rich copper-binding protein CopC